MMFANPWALLWLLLAAPIVWLYRRRTAMPEARVSTGAIWQQALAKECFRSWWLPRRHAVSLALQLLILVVAVVALAQPRLSPPHTTVLIIDNSASMNATDVEPTRFDAARRYGLQMIDTMSDGDQLGLLAGGAPIGVVCGLTGDRQQLHDALAALQPGSGTTQVAGAVDVARGMLEGHGQGRILVLTDACFPEASTLADVEDVDLVTVGGPAANTAVRRVAARRHPGRPETVQVLVEVAQYSDAPLAEVPLELRLGEKTLDAQAAETPTELQETRVYEMAIAEGDVLTAVVESDDVLPADNRGSTLISPAGIQRVTVPDELNKHLSAALAANPRVQIVQADAASADSPPAAPAIRILQGEVPARLPGGPLLVIDPRSASDFWEVDGVIEHAEIVTTPGVLFRSQLAEQPLSRDVLPLDGYVLSDVARLRLQTPEPGQIHVLAATTDGDPLLFALDRPTGRIVVLAGSPDTSELFQQVEFPALLAQALDWLGEPAVRAEWERLGEAAPAFPATESDLRAPPQVGTPTEQWRVPSRRPSLWQWLGAAALAMLLAEWCLYQRRWIS
ncbi:MAG: BatA and WFA domain-containing protein [Thermoguttaceae bacterium]|jgi:hypothetical protein|nr:BatA and WFA domain-containing protein [Thermoguttaceae bacterium]